MFMKITQLSENWHTTSGAGATEYARGIKAALQRNNHDRLAERVHHGIQEVSFGTTRDFAGAPAQSRVPTVRASFQ